jgi:hypothetical protein
VLLAAQQLALQAPIPKLQTVLALGSIRADAGEACAEALLGQMLKGQIVTGMVQDE